MKIHLPLPLRAALLAACTMASLTSFARAVVFENHDTSATDAFREKYGGGPSYTIEDELHFLNNHDTGDDVQGGALCVDGAITFRNCEEIEMVGNYAVGDSWASGGALYANGRVVFDGVGRVTLRDNSASTYGGAIHVEFGHLPPNQEPSDDFIVHEYPLIFRNCGDVEITGNHTEERSDEVGISGPFAGALNAGGDAIFEANDSVVLRGNYAAFHDAKDQTGYVLQSFYVHGDLVIKTKEGQTFECYDGGIAYNIFINGDRDHLIPGNEESEHYSGTVTFSGRHTEEDLRRIMGKTTDAGTIDERLVEESRFHYVIGYVHVCAGTLVLEDGVTLCVDTLFPPSSVDRYIVEVEESAKLVMKDSTIVARNNMYDPEKNDGDVSISSASFSGANTIYAPTLISSGGTWTFNVGEQNLTDPLVTLKFHIDDTQGSGEESVAGLGQFTSQAGTVFDIEFEGTLAEGQYKLLEFDKTDGTWEHESGIPKITGKAGSTTIGEAGEGDVYLMTDGDTVTLIFDVAGGSVEPEPNPEPSPEPEPEDRQPTTLTWGSGNGTWADGTGNEDGHWAGDVTDKNFYKGDSVVFSSAAEVTLQGVIRPRNVLVNNADGTVKFTGSGQITDVDIPSQQAKLIKEGAGTLVIDTNNAYTGGTELKAGTLMAGNAGALGLGVVRVSGGTLDMGGNALDNELDVAGTANVANGGKYAGKLVLESGTLSGNLNLEQDAELKGGTVAGALSGKGGAVVSGGVTLSGANTYAGKTTVLGGGNLHVTGSLESKELEVQSGGTYSGTIGGAGVNVNLAGGVVVGDVTLGEGSAIRATAQGAAVKGKLSVASGGRLSVRDVQEGATLSVSELVASGGTLGLDPAKPGALGVETFTTTGRKTALNVDDVLNKNAGEYTLLNYATLGSGSSVDSLYLAALEGLHSRKQFDLRLEQTSLTLSVKGESADLTWQGSTGTWNNSGTGGGWNTSAEDKQFYDGGRVTFDASTQNVEAKVEGTVTPGEVHVQGDKNVTLNGEGNIAGSAPLSKGGKGTLDMQTDNSAYTGDITVTEGTLRAGNANALGTGNVFVESATFDANNMNVAAKVTMRGQSTLENAGHVKTLTFDSGSSVKSTTGYTLSSGNTLTIGPTGSAYTGDFTFGGGTLALTGGAFDLRGANVTFSGEQHSVLDLSGWIGLTAGQEYRVFMGDMPTDKLDVRLGDGGTAHLETRGGEIVLVVDQPGIPPTAVAQGGAEYATAISSQTEGNMAHLRRLRGAIGSGQALSSDRKVGAYITGYTEDNRLEQDAQGLGYHRTEIGGTLGVETALKDGQFVGGAALSAGRAHISPTGPAPRYHEDVIREDLYFIANFGRLRSTTTVGLGQHEIDLRRAPSNGIAAPSQDVTGNSVNLSEELAVTFIRSEKHSFESFFAVESSYNHIDGFNEGGTDAASLAVDDHEAFATDLSLGLRANFLFPIVSSAPSAVFSVQGAAITSVGDTVTDVTMRHAGTPELPYSLRSAKRNRWGYSAGASLTVPVTPNTAIFGSSEAILRGDSHEVTATVGVKLTF